MFTADNNNRSNRPKVFCKKGALENFAKFKENTHVREKKETLAQVFSCEFCKIF